MQWATVIFVEESFCLSCSVSPQTNSKVYQIVLGDIYSSQHLKWIKKVLESCPKTRTHFGFRATLMKGFDPLQMLTSVQKKWTITVYLQPSKYHPWCSMFIVAAKGKVWLKKKSRLHHKVRSNSILMKFNINRKHKGSLKYTLMVINKLKHNTNDKNFHFIYMVHLLNPNIVYSILSDIQKKTYIVVS